MVRWAIDFRSIFIINNYRNKIHIMTCVAIGTAVGLLSIYLMDNNYPLIGIATLFLGGLIANYGYRKHKKDMNQ